MENEKNFSKKIKRMILLKMTTCIRVFLLLLNFFTGNDDDCWGRVGACGVRKVSYKKFRIS